MEVSQSSLNPPPPAHDLQPRQKLLKDLAGAQGLLRGPEKEEGRKLFDTVFKQLSSTNDFLGTTIIKSIRDLASQLKNSAHPARKDEADRALNLSGLLTDLANHEENSLPQRVRNILSDRRPQILSFDAEDRNLLKEYDLSAEDKRPNALLNLTRVARLDLAALLRSMKSKDVARVRELIDEANLNLKMTFSAAWVRNDVVPHLTADGTVLHLLVSTQNKGLSDIDERSDGLRWFIALVCFLEGKGHIERPILLVDEAETHLSYDAQASLVGVLETQTLAQKIIYTTHSAGCLPSDLGTGIRPVIPTEEETSKIQNGFWVHGQGFSPLLLAMGLGPLSFTAARNVLIGEGASECLLLPTLVRQATGIKQLLFQVAPGAATASPNDLSALLSEGGRVAFILDGDEGGRKRKALLLRAGAKSDHVITYADFGNDPLVFEDLIDPEQYVAAFNDELKRWQSAVPSLRVDDLPCVGRAAAVDAWCERHELKPVSKASLCQNLASKASNGSIVVSSKRKHLLVQFYEQMKSIFDIR